jgi:putative hydrolase of the HAD superfamily
MAHQIQFIIFDLGGVLVELDGPTKMLEWCPDISSMPELWRRWLANDAVRRYESSEWNTQEFAKHIVADFKLPVTSAEFLDNFAKWPRRLYPGVEALVTTLQKNYRVSCLSNTSSLHWARMRDHMGIDLLFPDPFLSFRMGMMKPDAAIFEALTEQLGAKPEQILYFDDNQINADGARAVGMVAHRVDGVIGASNVLAQLGILSNTTLHPVESTS